MLIVKPIREKKAQEALCLACGCHYEIDCLAYEALIAESIEKQDEGTPIGICQFKIGRIVTLFPVKGTDDWDGLFIMGRQTMNFIDLAGKHECILNADAFLKDTPSDFAYRLGFLPKEDVKDDIRKTLADGESYADLNGFFINPCQHGKAGSAKGDD